MRPRRTCPNPPPPSSGGRWAAHSTCSFKGLAAARNVSWSRSRVSSGKISSRTKDRIQSSCSSKSASVEKSHAMGAEPTKGRDGASGGRARGAPAPWPRPRGLLPSCLPVQLTPRGHELGRLLLHPQLDGLLGPHPVGCRVLPHVLADAHGAELGAAHGAEVRRLGRLSGQGLVMV